MTLGGQNGRTHPRGEVGEGGQRRRVGLASGGVLDERQVQAARNQHECDKGSAGGEDQRGEHPGRALPAAEPAPEAGQEYQEGDVREESQQQRKPVGGAVRD